MVVHLIKLAVGVDSVADLEARVAGRLRQSSVYIHPTRATPKRAAEVLSGGSIYWVVAGAIAARQPILELRPITGADGTPHCGIVLGTQPIRTVPRPRRPFQGWRYLDPADAPPDLAAGAGAELPEALRVELAALGLL